MSGLIRTLGGDIPADSTGPTFVHEHLIIDSPLVAREMEHIHLPSVDETATELHRCIAAGVRLMVDAMPAAAGRDPERLARVSILTGMRVVGATGLHTQRYYGDVPWTREESPEDLAARFVADIEEGIDQHDYRGDQVERTEEVKAGLIKVATLGEAMSGGEKRLFEAAAIAHTATGAPLLTHTEGGVGGLTQIDCLTGHGVSPNRIALSHTDKIPDPGYHREMLETGVSLCYDQALRHGDGPDNQTAGLIAAMVELGFGAQLMVGTDGARRSLWSTLGGHPGLAWLYTDLPESLNELGVSETAVTRLFEDNPAHYLTLGN